MGDDIDQIMTVMQSAFDPYWGEAWNRRQVEDALGFPFNHYVLLSPTKSPRQPGDEAAGFFMSRSGFEEEELLLLAVKPEFRHKGIGRSLVEILKNDAANRGAKRLLLEMRRGNDAEHLYADCGFYTIGERKDYYRLASGERLDAITFACDISFEQLDSLNSDFITTKFPQN